MPLFGKNLNDLRDWLNQPGPPCPDTLYEDWHSSAVRRVSALTGDDMPGEAFFEAVFAAYDAEMEARRQQESWDAPFDWVEDPTAWEMAVAEVEAFCGEEHHA